MKTFFKIVLFIIIIMVLAGIAQAIFDFSFVDFIKGVLGGTKLKKVHVEVGQEFVTPVFEVVTLEIFYPQNQSVIEAEKFEWWRLNMGTIFIFIKYDTYTRLGVRNPELIKIERIDNTVYVDESSIVIELLDLKINNFKHVRTFRSNPLVINNNTEEYILEALNQIELELIAALIENGESNFDFAKRNFMENYKNLCKAMGLEVVWR